MDVASQICWFWAEVGYVGERLLDQSLLMTAAKPDFRGNSCPSTRSVAVQNSLPSFGVKVNVPADGFERGRKGRPVPL